MKLFVVICFVLKIIKKKSIIRDKIGKQKLNEK